MLLPDRLRRLFDVLTLSPSAARCAVIRLGAQSDRAVQEQLAQEMPVTDFVEGVQTLEDLRLERADYEAAIVLLESLPSEAGAVAQVLGRLRDRHARRVLVEDLNASLSARELLALGFVGVTGDASSGTLYLHDPEDFFPKRDWNTAENWANPENFGKYRW